MSKPTYVIVDDAKTVVYQHPSPNIKRTSDKDCPPLNKLVPKGPMKLTQAERKALSDAWTKDQDQD